MSSLGAFIAKPPLQNYKNNILLQWGQKGKKTKRDKKQKRQQEGIVAEM